MERDMFEKDCTPQEVRAAIDHGPPLPNDVKRTIVGELAGTFDHALRDSVDRDKPTGEVIREAIKQAEEIETEMRYVGPDAAWKEARVLVQDLKHQYRRRHGTPGVGMRLGSAEGLDDGYGIYGSCSGASREGLRLGSAEPPPTRGRSLSL